jgi:hypothetical protein
MRHVKDFICLRLDMPGLVEDDFGMELLVGRRAALGTRCAGRRCCPCACQRAGHISRLWAPAAAGPCLPGGPGRSLGAHRHLGLPCPALPCPALPCPALPWKHGCCRAAACGPDLTLPCLAEAQQEPLCPKNAWRTPPTLWFHSRQVGGKIVDLSLPVTQVYELVWRPHVAAGGARRGGRARAGPAASGGPDPGPMVVVYRLAGLDGEATEPVVRGGRGARFSLRGGVPCSSRCAPMRS